MSKKQRTKYHVRKRMFLNRDLDMRAFVIALVQDTREIPQEDENAWMWGKIELTLGDCVRHVSFDFDLSSKAERSNSLHKIKCLAETINAVREALEIEAKSIEARQTVKPKAKAKGATNYFL